MPTPRKPSAAEAAVEVAAAVRQFGHDIADIKVRGARVRRITIGLAVSVAFDIVLSVILGAVALQARDATSAAAIAGRQQATTCQALNEAGKQQRELWEYAFSFPPPPGETTAEKARRLDTTAKFTAYLDKTFAARDCTK